LTACARNNTRDAGHPDLALDESAHFGPDWKKEFSIENPLVSGPDLNVRFSLEIDFAGKDWACLHFIQRLGATSDQTGPVCMVWR
jgi:hypothetical protein